jgi:hypothetical protein
MAEEAVVTPPVETKDAPVIEITDDIFLAELEKRTGYKPESLDTIKEKLNYQKPGPEPTSEEKDKAAKAFEKRMLDIHIANGNSPEQYTLLKQLANGDLKEISLNQTKAELKEAGFSDEKIQEIIKERYFQIDESEIELAEDDDQKELLKKKKEFGTKKLESRAAHIQKTAKSHIDSLAKSVNDLDAESKRMEQHTSKVEDAIKNYQRKQTLELGKVDDTDIPPIEDEIPEETLNEVKEILKDPVKFEQQLFTKDGDVNIDFILPHLVRSAS